jgi:predicted RNA-binding Zn-ribbon protein involved in translation (DUF1610 family)
MVADADRDRIASACQAAQLALLRLHVEVESLTEEPAAVRLEPAVPAASMRDYGAGFPCPRCGSTAIRRSHARGVEQVRKKMTAKRLFRCEACEWRGWREPKEAPPSFFKAGELSLDLAVLDDAPSMQDAAPGTGPRR